MENIWSVSWISLTRYSILSIIWTTFNGANWITASRVNSFSFTCCVDSIIWTALVHIAQLNVNWLIPNRIPITVTWIWLTDSDRILKRFIGIWLKNWFKLKLIFVIFQHFPPDWKPYLHKVSHILPQAVQSRALWEHHSCVYHVLVSYAGCWGSNECRFTEKSGEFSVWIGGREREYAWYPFCVNSSLKLFTLNLINLSTGSQLLRLLFHHGVHNWAAS